MKHRTVQRLLIGMGVLVSLYLLAVTAIPTMFPHSMCALTQSPVEEMRVLMMAVTMYHDTYNSYPSSLATLGPPAAGDLENSGHTGWIQAELASGRWLGYTFRYVPRSDARGRKSITGFSIMADPITEGPKRHHYFSDETGVLRAEKDHAATSSSQPTHDSGCTCAAPEDFVGP